MCTRVIMMELYRSAKGRWNNVWMKEHEKCVCELSILLSKILLRFCALLLSTLNECSLLSSSFIFLYIRCSKIRKFYDSIRSFHEILCFGCKDEQLISKNMKSNTRMMSYEPHKVQYLEKFDGHGSSLMFV